MTKPKPTEKKPDKKRAPMEIEVNVEARVLTTALLREISVYLVTRGANLPVTIESEEYGTRVRFHVELDPK